MNQISETWYKYTMNFSSSFMSILFHNLKVWVRGVFFFKYAISSASPMKECLLSFLLHISDNLSLSY